MSPVKPPTSWRLVLCDLFGNALSIITSISSDIELLFRLNRPAQLSFSVPSDDRLVSTLYGVDEWPGSYPRPWLHAGNRIVKMYRKLHAGEQGGWECRFVGRVWNIQDQGDGDTCRTAVVCYDALYDLTKRIVRNRDGSFDTQVNWWDKRSDVIIKQMIDRTNTYGERETMISTDTTWTATATMTPPGYDQAMIWPSISTITDTGVIDLLPQDESGNIGYYPDYSDGSKVWPPTHLYLAAGPRRGSDEGAIIGYAGPPRNATGYNRTQDMSTFANDITGWGKSNKGFSHHATDTDSMDEYGSFEDAFVLTDIERKEFVIDLVEEQLALRRIPRDLVSFEPQPESAISPFVEFNCGDRITVNAGTVPNPETRQQLSGLQRIYGFRLTYDDDYGEKVSELIVSADAEGE